MKSFATRGALSAGILLLFSIAARASEQMRGANVLEAGKWAASLYGVRAEQKDLEFSLGGAGLITVPLQGGGTAQFFGGGASSVEFDGEATSAILRLTWRPGDGLQYGLKAGAGDYEVRVPSGAVVNELSNGAPGRIWGADASWTVVSNSPVTPALALGAGYARSDYRIDRLQSGGAVSAVDQRFVLEEWQAGLTASWRWQRLEPYGGLRFFRQTSVLRDASTAESVRGDRDGFSPFLGLKLEFLPRESLVIEVSAMDETLVALGLAVGF
jgi:hypothetical protein